MPSISILDMGLHGNEPVFCKKRRLLRLLDSEPLKWFAKILEKIPLSHMIHREIPDGRDRP